MNKKSLGPKTIVFPTPVFIVGTYDRNGTANVMSAAWGGICCSKPPCVAVSLRAATYSHGNIVARKAFTISIPSTEHVKEADYFGIASGRTENKLDVAGLTPVKSDLVDAPYVAEFPMVLECSLLRTVEIGLHTQFIGEIRDLKADESVLNRKNLPDIEKVRPFLYDPAGRAYFSSGERLGDAFSAGKSLLG